MNRLSIAGSRLLPATLGLLVLLVMAGCQLQPEVDLGPNPALVELTMTASFTPKDVQDGMDSEQLFSPFYIEGAVQNTLGPFWDWGLYLVTQNGAGLVKLPTVEKIQTRRMRADKLKVKVTFQAPPGKHKYLILADAYLEYYNASVMVRPVDIKTYKDNFSLELAPGQRKVLNKSYSD